MPPSPSIAYRQAGYRATGLWSEATLADVLARRAAAHPDRELFLFEGRRVSYGEFEAWTRSVAADMLAGGLRRGDRVLVQLPNCLEALVVQVAAFRAGAVDVPVVPIYREHEMRQILADCRPTVVCSTATLGSRSPFYPRSPTTSTARQESCCQSGLLGSRTPAGGTATFSPNEPSRCGHPRHG